MTQPIKPPITPPPPPRQQPPAPLAPPKPKRRARRQGGLYLPAWSILLMLAIVGVTAAGIVGLVLALGGTPAPQSDPVIVIITSQPATAIQNANALGAPTPGAPTATRALLPAQVPAGSYPTFALEGPTLPPVILSPTPLAVAIGAAVEIDSDDPVNVRAGAGIDQEFLFFANRGEQFVVVGGPEQATGFAWWQIEDPADAARGGWIAANFVRAVPR